MQNLQLSQFIFSYFVNFTKAYAMKRIITDKVKESNEKERLL